MHIRKIVSLTALTIIVLLGISGAGVSKPAAAQEPAQTQSAINLQSDGPNGNGSCVCSPEKSDECQQVGQHMHCCAIWNQYSGCRVFCATACQIY